MNRSVTAACIQNCAGSDLETNAADASELVRSAAAAGADLICLPEFFSCLDKQGATLVVGTHPEPHHPALAAFQKLAAELGKWVLLGSLAISSEGNRFRNRSYLLDDRGAIVARYDKIHMFDVDLAGGEHYRESDLFAPGSEAIIAATPWGALGMTVCYDLRFAYLYRALAQAGAMILTIPAAFTRTTGKAHWHVLIRSRAIETGCFIVAPSQCGDHGDARTYGHSLIVDPWGEILADAGAERGFVTAELDLGKVGQARRMIPALRHDRDYRLAGGPAQAARAVTG